jgi:hypothetical protein
MWVHGVGRLQPGEKRKPKSPKVFSNVEKMVPPFSSSGTTDFVGLLWQVGPLVWGKGVELLVKRVFKRTRSLYYRFVRYAQAYFLSNYGSLFSSTRSRAVHQHTKKKRCSRTQDTARFSNFLRKKNLRKKPSRDKQGTNHGLGPPSLGPQGHWQNPKSFPSVEVWRRWREDEGPIRRPERGGVNGSR